MTRPPEGSSPIALADSHAPDLSGARARRSTRRATIYPALTALLATAYARLWLYDLSSRLRGPDPDRAAAILGRWNRWAWAHLRLQVRINGWRATGPRVYVSNHRSYLDIPVLSGVLDATFLSRADVSSWPLVGAVARRIGTVFVARDDPQGRMRAARTLMRRVRTAGIVVFAEGTTGGDRLPGPFHDGLFRLMQRLGTPVVPITVRYSDRKAYWTDDVTLWEHLRDRVYCGAPLTCTVDIGEEIRAGEYADASSLAHAVRVAVCRPIEEGGELA